MAAQEVVAYVRRLIESGALRQGDRLPPERELSNLVSVSRPSVRAGLQALAAMGVVESRHGSGTFIADGLPLFDSGSLRLLAALAGITEEQLSEVRRVLEVDVAELAAERATGEQLAAISEEVMEMFASSEDPEHFLVHDIRFHRAVAEAGGNPVLGALVEAVAEIFSEQRRRSVYRWHGASVAAEQHRMIYQAIRDHDRERARREMDAHLRWAFKVQEQNARTRSDLETGNRPGRKREDSESGDGR